MFGLQQLKKKQEAQAEAAPTVSVAHLRAQKDHGDLQLPSTVELEIDDPDNLMEFRFIIKPDEGMYNGGKFVFSVNVGQEYPDRPPKVLCQTKIYHPNIDLDGNVCLNILRDDWTPVQTFQSIAYGLIFLFLVPNPDDPLNREAAQMLAQNKEQFKRNVRKAMQGGHVDGVTFDYCL
eukprot:m.356888 g.356888  ORF g.356888 m.356888 type:complete len:177 (+) comp17651_c0_seq1:80-610(+)